MYTNEDLNQAVNEGIFTQDSIEEFRDYIAEAKNITVVDEENFKLLSGFNDIFVVIASILLLSSAGWIASSISSILSALVVALLSWGLSEFFVLKRKMALPAIVLLLAFAGAVFGFMHEIFDLINTTAGGVEIVVASAFTAFAIFLHWKRFSVPITVAIGMGTVALFFISLFMESFPQLKEYLSFIIFTFGIAIFIIAMRWDMKDRRRVSNSSDVAFWLHLLASPLIIHSLFLGLGVFDNQISMLAILLIIFSYIVLSSISLLIDRRALMVSSLLYVLYALNSLFTKYGLESYGLAIGGVIIGVGLLLLTAFWTKARAKIVTIMPHTIQLKVPTI